MIKHNVEAVLSRTMNEILNSFPKDPYSFIISKFSKVLLLIMYFSNYLVSIRRNLIGENFSF